MTARKGLGAWQFDIRSAANVSADWGYNWTPYDHNSGNGVEFVPMIWGDKHNNDSAFAAAQGCAAAELLGFNEPDGSDQSNMSVDDALDIWPKLIATGKRLGSPAVARSYDWQDQFMDGCKARGLALPAFQAVHTYPDLTNVDAFIGFLQWCNSRYGLPIWLTEFGVLTWTDQNTVNAFIKAALPKIRDLPFVERYAWFCDANYGNNTNVFNSDGSLTDTGNAYQRS